MPPRVRLTNEAIANINVAEKVELIPVKGGYQAQAKNEYGAEYLSTGDGTAVYPNRAAAIRSIKRHNEKVEIVPPKTLPSPSMRPKE